MMSDDLEDFPLPLRQVMDYPMRGDIAAGKEAHPDAAGLFAELGLRVTSFDAKFDNFLCATPPALDDAPKVEHFGD